VHLFDLLVQLHVHDGHSVDLVDQRDVELVGELKLEAVRLLQLLIDLFLILPSELHSEGLIVVECSPVVGEEVVVPALGDHPEVTELAFQAQVDQAEVFHPVRLEIVEVEVHEYQIVLARVVGHLEIDVEGPLQKVDDIHFELALDPVLTEPAVLEVER